MPATMTPEQAELRTLFKQITGGSDQDFEDVLALPADKQVNALACYRDAIYDVPPDQLAKFMAVAQIVGTVVGVVSGIAGAAGGIVGLANAIKTLRQ